jgi:RNA polymerase sigma-70 factor (ECF subfamily)
MAESWLRWKRAVPPDHPGACGDEQLMWRVRMSDDPQAFAALMQRWEKPIHGLCARMTGDVHRAQDLSQDAFARLFARRKSYEPSGRFSTFLWRIALNLCYDELRRLKRRPELPLDTAGRANRPDEPQDDDAGALPSSAPAPDAIVAGEERAAAVRAALGQLSEPYRAVLVLRHYEGLKFREIADVLDIPEGTVKSRMAEALSQLGRLLMPALNERENLCNETKPRVILAI